MPWRKRGTKKHITCLLVENSTHLLDLMEMWEEAWAFYASLFSPDLTDADVCRVLWDELPMLKSMLGDRIDTDQTSTVPCRTIFGPVSKTVSI
ncbi:unnamed protein product [Caretta caretta]